MSTDTMGYLTFTDQVRNTATMRLNLPNGTVADDAAFVALRVAIIGISLAANNRIGIMTEDEADEQTDLAAQDGAYEDVEDKAVFLFQTEGGGTVQMQIPSPDATIFLADKKTVNPANSLVVALVTAAIGFLENGGAQAVVALIRAYRRRAKTKGTKPGAFIV